MTELDRYRAALLASREAYRAYSDACYRALSPAECDKLDGLRNQAAHEVDQALRALNAHLLAGAG